MIKTTHLKDIEIVENTTVNSHLSLFNCKSTKKIFTPKGEIFSENSSLNILDSRFSMNLTNTRADSINSIEGQVSWYNDRMTVVKDITAFLEIVLDRLEVRQFVLSYYKSITATRGVFNEMFASTQIELNKSRAERVDVSDGPLYLVLSKVDDVSAKNMVSLDESSICNLHLKVSEDCKEAIIALDKESSIQSLIISPHRPLNYRPHFLIKAPHLPKEVKDAVVADGCTIAFI